MLTGLITFISVEGEVYVSFKIIFYNGTNLTKKENINQFSQTQFVTGNM
jgi:hypothetical protein